MLILPRVSVRPRPGFNEAAGADPADANLREQVSARLSSGFNEAAGADPADASARPLAFNSRPDTLQ